MKREHVVTLYRELARTRSAAEASAATARVLGVALAALPRVRRAPLSIRPLPRRPGVQDLRRLPRCVRGHAFSRENTIWRRNGTRMCRECHRDRVRANDARRLRCRARGVAHGNSRCRCRRSVA